MKVFFGLDGGAAPAQFPVFKHPKPGVDGVEWDVQRAAAAVDATTGPPA